jgi:hypothetical protein
MPLRESYGISAGEMYRLKILNARSSNDRFAQSFFQFDGREGIASGTNSPLSDARPFRTASSKETYKSIRNHSKLREVEYLPRKNLHGCSNIFVMWYAKALEQTRVAT